MRYRLGTAKAGSGEAQTGGDGRDGVEGEVEPEGVGGEQAKAARCSCDIASRSRDMPSAWLVLLLGGVVWRRWVH